MWVVKLGGSLADSDFLPLWLDALGRCSGVVLVPGGGPFADAVREAQVRWAFSDHVAHDMAILGMRQYGMMLADLGSLRRGSDPGELANCEECAVWLPLPDALNAAGICASWEITSDSIAAWLAAALNAANLLLVKCMTLSQRSFSASELVSRGLVDGAFADFFHRSGSHGWIAGPEDHRQLRDALARPAEHFVRIES